MSPHTPTVFVLSDDTVRSAGLEGRRVLETDPQTVVALGIETPMTAMCVRIVNVRVSCSSHIAAHFAAFFIDPRAK